MQALALKYVTCWTVNVLIFENVQYVNTKHAETAGGTFCQNAVAYVRTVEKSYITEISLD